MNQAEDGTNQAPDPDVVHLDMDEVAAALRDPEKVKEGSMQILFARLCEKLRK